MNNYQEICGTLVRKRRSLCGVYNLYINDGKKTVRITIGKALFEECKIGMKLTVGFIGHKTINFRPDVCKNG